MSAPSPQSDPRPHPLAEVLCERLAAGAAVLELGTGRGRNTAAFARAGMDVIQIADVQLGRFTAQAGSADAVFSSHGFLHGTVEQITGLLQEAAASLRAGGLLYATFASTNDARFGEGTRLGPCTFAPHSGDEAGVAHSYFDMDSLRALLACDFEIEDVREENVDDVVGRWAHSARRSGSVHWFVRAVRRN